MDERLFLHCRDMTTTAPTLDLPALHARLLASVPLVQAITNTVV